MPDNAILQHITNYYLKSTEFNGMPCVSLADRMNMDLGSLTPYIRDLILSEKVSVVYGDRHPNPFIRALDDDPPAEQIAKLIPEKLEYACIYPLNSHLETVVDKHLFHQQPYTLKLALGTPLYAFDFFDPTVLHRYHNLSECAIKNDIQGILNLPYVTISFSKAIWFSDSGQPLTEVLALSLEQLVRLSEFDQEHWHSMSLPVEGTIHPDILHPLMEGVYRQRLSIFEALHEEMMAVNGLCNVLEKPPLFIMSQGSFSDIWNMGFITPTTLSAFKTFFLQFQIQLLQNVNPKFLHAIAPAPVVRSFKRTPTPLRRPSKTSLERLADWMADTFPIGGQPPLKRLIALIKKNRVGLEKRLAQEDPHLTDPSLLYEQRRLIWNAYLAIKWIRIQFEQASGTSFEPLHPLARTERIWAR